MKIVLFILRIAAAIACGIASVTAMSMVSEILYTISFGLWCMCVGMDIAQFINDN